MTEPNASGKPVQKITSMKISQTWLASHTGAIDCLIIAAHARAALRAAGGQVPEAGAEVRPAEHGVGRQRRAQSNPAARSASIGQPRPRAAAGPSRRSITNAIAATQT